MHKRLILPIYLLGFFLFLSLPVNAQILKSIQQVSFNQQNHILTVFSNQPLVPELQYVQKHEKHQIIMDLPDTVFHPVHQKISSSNSIEKIRISQFSSDPPQVRMVWDLANPGQLSVNTKKIAKGYKTEIQSKALPDLSAPLKTVSYAPVQVAQSIKELTELKIENNNLILKGNTSIVPEIRSTQARQYTLVLHDFKSGLKTQPSLNSALIKQVNVLQKSDRLEIRFELSTERLEVVPFSQNKECLIQLIPKVQKKNTLKIQNIDVYEMSPEFNRVRIFSQGEFDYQIYPLENPHRLVVDTMGTTLPSFTRRLMDSSLLKKVSLSPVHTDTGTDIRFVFELKNEVKYQAHFNTLDNYLELTLQARQALPRNNYNALIVIDPGHGGHDPGAIGKKGTREKSVALKVSQYLKRYLTNDRHKVLLTRSEDIEVLLQPRVDVANLRNADLFVSVHLNSMPPGNTHVNGVETYYTTPQSLALANTLNQYLVNELQAKNRGVRKRGLYVTRKTKMPSVLLEIGFLSNPGEEGKLGRSAYQRKVAKAIRDGIENYLSKHPPKKRPRN